MNFILHSSVRWAVVTLTVWLATFMTNFVNADEPVETREMLELRARVFPLSKRIDQDVWDSMTSAQQGALIDFLHQRIQKLRKGGYNIGRSSEGEQLAILGDSEGTSAVAASYLAQPTLGSETLLSVNSPKLIAEIGEGLFKDEPLYRRDVDLGLVAAQEVTRADILKLLVRTGAFSDEVVSWAKRMQTAEPFDPEGVKIMREWFKGNDMALRLLNFREVKPGIEPIRKVKNVIDGGDNNGAPGHQPNVPLGAQFSNPLGTQLSVKKTTTVALDLVAKNSWVWAAVAIVAILGSVVFYLLQRQRTKR